MKIQQAEKAHIDFIAELNLEVQNTHCELYPDYYRKIDSDELKNWLLKVIEDEKFITLIATENDNVVGYILIQIVHRDETLFMKELNYINIDQIAVAKDSRGKGIGKALINSVIELAKRMNINSIKLNHWEKNEPAGKIFEALGFETTNKRMVLKL